MARGFRKHRIADGRDHPHGQYKRINNTRLYQRSLIGCNADGILMGCINIIWHTYDHLSDIFDFYT
jgi:hypothetical protein